MSADTEQQTSFARGSLGGPAERAPDGASCHHGPQPPILRLLREASKLAPPARSNVLADSLAADREGRDRPRPSPDLCRVAAATLRGVDPWDVMGLINLQCEKLLHGGESDCRSPFPAEEGGDNDVIGSDLGVGTEPEMRGRSQSPAEVVHGDVGPVWPSTSSSAAVATVTMEMKPAPPVDNAAANPPPRPPRPPRKQPRPSRSADLRDPSLRGVAFRMWAEPELGGRECRLHISCSEFPRKERETRRRAGSSLISRGRTSSDDGESVSAERKACASCCAQKTPMWRDAEDGTPLCNACGIRYRKYHVRCPQCWHIPRKGANGSLRCLKCGHVARVMAAQRRHLAW